MDKLISVNFNGKTYYLNYSMAVMFDVTEKYGDVQALLSSIQKGGKEEFDNVRWLFARLAEDGELCRREAGYDKQEFIKPEEITLRMKPYEYAEIVQGIIDAVTYGFYREVENVNEDSEIDIGLAELNQKKTKTGK